MSTEVQSPSAVEETPIVVVPLQPKNTNRLQRIFRKPKSTVAARSWRSAEDAATRRAGVTKQMVAAVVSELTQTEKERAAAHLEPLTATQEALAMRAARFGVMVTPASSAVAPIMVVDDETLKRREARFKSADDVAREAAMSRREARFGGAPAPVEIKLSEEDRAAMEARARRFAA